MVESAADQGHTGAENTLKMVKKFRKTIDTCIPKQ